MRQLAGAGYAARTQARRISAIRQFHRFLASEGIRPDDPTELLESPRLPASLPKALSEAEMEALIAAAAALLVTLVILSGFPPPRYRAENGMVTVSDSHRHPPPIPAPPGHY